MKLYTRNRRYIFVHLIAASLIINFSACTSSKYATTNRVYKKQASDLSKVIKATPPDGQLFSTLSPDQQAWVGAVNFGIRKPNYVILHHTAQTSTEQTIRTFTLARTGVSSHYVVGRDGKVVQMVNDLLRAHHAGAARWGNDRDLNSSSIGIEIDNNGSEPYSNVQIESVIKLLLELKTRYKIPAENFIGHADIAPTRKPDPANFPWKKLAEKGLGLWYDEILDVPPLDFNGELALRVIGYDISNVPAAITAFKRHFVQTDITPVLTESDKAILYNLYKKYL